MELLWAFKLGRKEVNTTARVTVIIKHGVSRNGTFLGSVS
jgi:hypothetical protein